MPSMDIPVMIPVTTAELPVFGKGPLAAPGVSCVAGVRAVFIVGTGVIVGITVGAVVGATVGDGVGVVGLIKLAVGVATGFGDATGETDGSINLLP